MKRKIKILLLVGFVFLFSNFCLGTSGDKRAVLKNDTRFTLLVGEYSCWGHGEPEFVHAFCVSSKSGFSYLIHNNRQIFLEVFVLRDDGVSIEHYCHRQLRYDCELILSECVGKNNKHFWFEFKYRPLGLVG